MAFSTELLCHVRSTVQLHMFCLVSCTTAAGMPANPLNQRHQRRRFSYLFRLLAAPPGPDKETLTVVVVN